MRRLIVSLCALLPLAATAHHSGAAFDPALRVEVSGTVSKIEWTNPHARLYVNVKDENGASVEWEFELPSMNHLTRQGWSKRTLAIGDHVTATGARARHYPHVALAQNILNADGAKLFMTAPAAD